MADLTFLTTSGETVKRELLIAYLHTSNTGGNPSNPVWSPIGSRVTDSSEELDWSEDSSTDILGVTRTTMKKPVITQTFDPWDLDGGDAAILKIWNLAIKDQDYSALAAQDVLIVHCYAGASASAMFAERYEACAIRPTGLGGEGGGVVGMPIDITYGGKRTVGTASISAQGAVTFSAST